ncbi:MAG: hypothetical protein V1743_08055 [Nanoarchaeota archaeon]
MGIKEKSQFLDQLVRRIASNRKEERVLRRLFWPSYGGNRNWTLLGTLGKKAISIDDDMAPYGLYHRQQAKLAPEEVLKGIFLEKGSLDSEIEKRENDIYTAFIDVLGKQVKEISQGAYRQGDSIIDSMNDPLLNTTTIPLGQNIENSISLTQGKVNPEARIMLAQTPKTGWADLDAKDFAEDCLTLDLEDTLDSSFRYIIKAYHPFMTNDNWRLDTGVLAFDNSQGLPPFIPTRLRTEEFSYRIWISNPAYASAHVNAVQTHNRNQASRDSLGVDLWNEAVGNYLRKKLLGLTRGMDDITVTFERDGNVPLSHADQIREIGNDYYHKFLKSHERLKQNQPTEKHATYFFKVAEDIYRCFFSFDQSVFHRDMQEVIKAELNSTIDGMALWPKVIQVTRDMQKKGKFPFQSLDRRQ